MRFAFFVLFGGVVLAACTNDFDRFDFGGGGEGGVGPTTTVTTTSVGGGPATTTSTGGGMGGCTSPATCPGQDTDCRQRTCINGECGFEVELAGTQCNDGGGNLCDGIGFCVECLADVDCAMFADGGVCDNGTCLPADCMDAIVNNDETDVDCGGETCDPCMDGLACMTGTDCASGVCTGNVCVPCSGDLDCAALGAFWCDAGVCAAQGALGDPCSADAGCQSGFCPGDDGICCDSACGSLCESCLMADTGVADGTCAPVSAGTDPKGECTADAATCTGEQCSGTAGQCQPAAGGTTCRASMGLCDVAETCDGVTTGCPADAKQPTTAVCRIAADLCDAPETCDGVNAACPPDQVQPSTTVCRPAAGLCDVPELCDGSSIACPADDFLPDGASSIGGACDPYLCDGAQAGCPTSCSSSADCTGSCNASMVCE